MLNIVRRFFTKNNTEIPLFWVTFDLQRFRNGEEKYCTANRHPNFIGDEIFEEKLKDLIDYIKFYYDKEGF